MSEEDALLRLLAAYQEGKATPEEQAALNRWMDEYTTDQAASAEPDYTKLYEQMRATWLKEGIVPPPAKIHRIDKARIWLRWSAAAALLLLVAGGLYIYRSSRQVTLADVQAVKPAKDRPPGGNKAVLTLSGGQRIILDSAASGVVASQGNTTVQKLTGGRLAYQATGGKAGEVEEVLYNTLSTPRGGQYQLTLPDGSKVWLNAASSITYPTAFTGPERKITITGEAYFEVVHDPARPFVVARGETEIRVLGTAFNVNAYTDEPDMRVTLSSGKVQVKTGTHAVTLLPGQQAVVTPDNLRVNKDADMNEVLAWKNGMFLFNGTDLATIMRQVSRWYNVEVVFEAPITEKFYVEISRNTNASNLLKMLAITKGAHFRIEGAKVIVTP
jgi:transmembrane sensor